MTQDLGIGSSPSFGSPYFTGITAGLMATLAPDNQVYGISPTVGKVVMGMQMIGSLYPSWGKGDLLVGSSMTVTRSATAPSITFNTIQDIQTTATPEFSTIKASSTTADTLLCTNATKQLTTATILNAGGCSGSFYDGTLHLATAGRYWHADIRKRVHQRITVNSLLGTTVGNKVARLNLASNKGVTATISAAELTISTPQDVRTTAKPQFAAVGATTGPCLSTRLQCRSSKAQHSVVLPQTVSPQPMHRSAS